MAYLFFKLYDENKNPINELIAIAESDKGLAPEMINIGTDEEKNMVKNIIIKYTNLTIHQIHELTNQFDGVPAKFFNWTDHNNPIVSQNIRDAFKWMKKKKKMQSVIKKYAATHDIPTQIEKVIYLDMWDELTEAQWRQIETIYDAQTG